MITKMSPKACLHVLRITVNKCLTDLRPLLPRSTSCWLPEAAWPCHICLISLVDYILCIDYI